MHEGCVSDTCRQFAETVNFTSFATIIKSSRKVLNLDCHADNEHVHLQHSNGVLSGFFAFAALCHLPPATPRLRLPPSTVSFAPTSHTCRKARCGGHFLDIFSQTRIKGHILTFMIFCASEVVLSFMYFGRDSETTHQL